MKAAQLRRLVHQYRKMFESEGVGKADFSPDKLLGSIIPGYEHCHSMLDKIESFISQNRMDKAYRWIGFVQGVLWTRGLRTINELREENK